MVQLTRPPSATTVDYSLFRSQVSAGNVSQVTANNDSISGTFRTAVRYPPGTATARPVTQFKTQRPAFGDDGLTPLLLQKGVKVTASAPSTSSTWVQVLLGFGPTVLLLGLLFWVFRRAASGVGGLGAMGQSRAKLYAPAAGPRTTFEDVAGIDEVKAEVEEIVDYLKRPEFYRKLGATIPKGVLLTGPPGAGKTLLARAVAGEADVPFFSVSASEFIEMIVGVGASRVRDLFDRAKKAAPAIIFIDELDAIGRARGGNVTFGGHDEREQTLNQILTEMDGFTGTEGVVVLAATNRHEILDPALLRAGRFDRRVVVNPPDQRGRTAILGVHTRSVPLAPDVDLSEVAATTPGMVGADLRNLVNEAALLAARRRHSAVQRTDFSDALEKIMLGSERRLTMTSEERERTAYHESGHALVGMLTPGADPVRKISIIPRGHSLGATLQAPLTDRYSYSMGYLRGRIMGALGGRAAEELVFGDVTSGAETDLEQVTAIARQMVGRWGMSPAIGPLSVLPAPGREQSIFDADGPSSATRELVDGEVHRIVADAYADTLQLLRAHRTQLGRLANELLRRETLDAPAAFEVAGLGPVHSPPMSPASPRPGEGLTAGVGAARNPGNRGNGSEQCPATTFVDCPKGVRFPRGEEPGNPHRVVV